MTVTNEELASMIDAHSAAVDKRLAAIETDMRALAGIRDVADTLEVVAQTWQLADLGGRMVKWLATLLAGLAAIWLFVRDGPQ